LATKEALAAIEVGDMEKMVDIALDYYDKTYGYGLNTKASSTIVRVPSDTCDAAVNAELVRVAAQNLVGATSISQH
jgi:tRNA 2-selenouridine synthase